MPERQLHLFRSRRQRGVVAPAPSEFQLHCAVADTLRRWVTPNWTWCHYPAGEERTAQAGARLKRMGVQPGFPDLILFPPKDHPISRAHFLELKRRRARLSEPQASFALWCGLNDCPFAVTDRYDLAVKILQTWGALRTGVHVQ